VTLSSIARLKIAFFIPVGRSTLLLMQNRESGRAGRRRYALAPSGLGSETP
jgi:hypothetical protein